MEKVIKRIPDFDDIVFEIRNKEYGAYVLRKNYNQNVLISLLTALVIMVASIITPYFNARTLQNRQKRDERQVEIKMQNLDLPNEIVAPPVPPPPPPADVVQQVKFIPPVIVDTVKADETTQLMTADEARVNVKNEDAVEVAETVREEVKEEDPEPQPFIIVEEMPEPPGGLSGLFRFINENIRYPEIARENNIQGKVVIKFCVTSKGGVDLVSVIKGVDPELDAEAIRVVKSLPLFKPGRQGGRPVPVWFSVPISFQIK